MADTSVYLFEVDPWTGAAVQTQYYATASKTTQSTDTPANTLYDGRVIDLGQFSRTFYRNGATLGQVDVGVGAPEFNNNDGALDDWLNWGFDGRDWRIKRLPNKDAPVSSASLVYSGLVKSIDSPNGFQSLRLNLSDARLLLQRPLLTAKYAGTTNSASVAAEGTTDLKDVLKPYVFGKCLNVLPVVVNPFNLVYQVSAGAVSVITVYDGGVALTNVGDVGTLAALIAGVYAPGTYATCNVLGLFKLGGSALSTVTADVTEGATLALRSGARIATRMLTLFASNYGLVFSTGSFDALHTFNSAEQGIYITDDQTAEDAVSSVIGPVGGVLMPDSTGVLRPTIVQAPTGTSQTTFTLRDIDEANTALSLFAGPGPDGAGVPAWSIVVTWGRIWHRMSGGDVVALVSDAQKAILTGPPRQVIAQSSAVKTAHKNAIEITVDSLLTTQADAQALATRLLAMYSVRRDRLSLPIVKSAEQVTRQPGDIVTLQMQRLGYSAGRKFLVCGRTDDFTRRIVTLELWG